MASEVFLSHTIQLAAIDHQAFGSLQRGRKQVHEKVKMMSCRETAASTPALKQVVQSVVNGCEPFAKLASGPC